MGIVKKMYSNLIKLVYLQKWCPEKRSRDEQFRGSIGTLESNHFHPADAFFGLSLFRFARRPARPVTKTARVRTPRLRRPMRQALAAISWMVVSFPRDCNLADWVCCRATISSFHQFLSVYHSDDDPHFILLFLGQVETTNRKKLGGSIAVGQNVSDISRSDDTDFG